MTAKLPPLLSLKINRRLLRQVALLSGTLGLALILGCAGGRDEQAVLTLDRTLQVGPDNFLEPGPGEPYQVRTELAQAQVGREDRRRSLLVFHNLSDTQIVDEESPLRGEWFDACPDPISPGAFRPQEAMTPHVTNSAVRQANRISSSPVSGRRVDFVLHTGNAIDNAQQNELRWFIALMDGGEITPDSGVPRYEGVQTKSPDPRYPQALEQAQQAFRAEGLRFPWYSVIGNHDVLVQGNFLPNESSNSIAVGTRKVIDLSPDRKEQLCRNPVVLLDPQFVNRVYADPKTRIREVEPDPDRQLLSRLDWIREHFNTEEGPGPIGHGFTRENIDKNVGYYAFEHEPISFIVLDTASPGGFSSGSLDQAQFRWLEEQLVARSSRYFDATGKETRTGNKDKLIVVASHHGRETLNNPFPDPAAPGPRVLGDQFEELLHRFPNVILHVAGHSHANRVWARADPKRRTAGYWEVNTSAQLDYPMQSRLVEIIDNRDGTLSIFGTILDIAAPRDPAEAHDPTPGDSVNEEQLASLARQIAVTDPQVDLEAIGLAASDRNVELLIPAPFDLAAILAPPWHRQLTGPPRS